MPGTNIAYWGPEIKVGVPQPALNYDMDAHTNVESLSFSFRRRQHDVADRLHSELTDEDPDSDSDSQTESAAAAAGSDSGADHQHHDAEGHGQALPDGGDRRGLAVASRSADAVSGSGIARRGALRPPVKGAATGRRARRGHGFRRAVLRQERHHHDQAGRDQTEFSS